MAQYMKNSEIKQKTVDRTMENSDADNHEVSLETVYSSLAHYNFPDGSMDHAKDIMPATVEDVPRIRTWTEYNINNKDEDITAPSLFYQANGEIKQLLTLKLDELTVNYINEKGLHIYLFEPMCLYIADDPMGNVYGNRHNYGFYTEFYNKMPDFDCIRATELDSIHWFMGKNGIHNVTVHTGDYRIEHFCTHYAQYMTLLCNDPFLNELIMYDNADTTVKRKFEKHFVGIAWRWHSCRAAALSILKSTNSANLVWYFNTPLEILNKTPWMQLENKYLADYSRHSEQIKTGLHSLNAEAPFVHDVPAKQATLVEECAAHEYPKQTDFDGMGNPVVLNPTRLPLQSLYRNAFCDVVTESRFGQPTGNISEKVLQSIQFKTPFLLFAPAFSLQYMHELGYQTFGQWWDESYDTIECHIERFDAIVDIINWIAGQKLDDLHNLYRQMWPVLQHNYKQQAINSRLGFIVHLEHQDLNNATQSVEWAQSDGPSMAELIENERNNREY